VMLGICPLALLSLAMVSSESQSVLGMNGLVFGALIIAGGVALYLGTARVRARRMAEQGFAGAAAERMPNSAGATD
jgi:hypothetical protein